ncbi:fructokinase [Paracoccus alkenifer]|uniref:Fructokinase n=2 Tax=Paracoccus alkenifer TaxID=65735 RepID=A0A1H6JMI3_9RHOB|nr:fructokinase [Paracoccus alkenifer]
MGEALVDLVPQPDGSIRPQPGGGAWNTALTLGRLGVATSLAWPISRDAYGALLLAPLAAAGVETSLCPRSNRPTALARIDLNSGDATYRFDDENSAGRIFLPAQLPPLPTDCRALVIGGISLAAEPCGSTVEQFATDASRRGIPLIFDLNIRPQAIQDKTEYRARLDRLLTLSHLVKLSAEDAAWLAPDTAPDETAARILALGPRIVVLTRGAQGAMAMTRRHRLHAAAVPATVADSIGAGDSFNAAFLASLLHGDALDSPDSAALTAALTLATTAAAITVSRPGADPPWADEL